MADDRDLEDIRAKRLAELQQQYGGPGGQQPSSEQREEQMRQQQEMKNSILSQILEQSARARLNTIAVAKPEKAQMLENMIIQMAQSRGLAEKITDDQLKQLLEQVSDKMQKKTTVKYDRRRAALDSDDSN